MQILWRNVFQELPLEIFASFILNPSRVLYPFPIYSSCLICFTGLLHARGFLTTASLVASLVTIMMLHWQNPSFLILPFLPCAFLTFLFPLTPSLAAPLHQSSTLQILILTLLSFLYPPPLINRVQLLLLFCFSPLDFHLFFPAAHRQPPISQLWDTATIISTEQMLVGLSSSDTVPTGG